MPDMQGPHALPRLATTVGMAGSDDSNCRHGLSLFTCPPPASILRSPSVAEAGGHLTVRPPKTLPSPRPGAP